MARILVVDDEAKMRHLLSIMLESKGHEVSQAGDGLAALAVLKDVPHDMVITDIKMPQMDGLALLNKIKAMQNPPPVVFITAFATVDSAVDAMRAGAADYITKPFEEERIFLTVERTLNLGKILDENRTLKAALQKASGSDKIIYASDKMARLTALAERVAKNDTAVLISGESGTGKELFARFIHERSPRCSERFVPLNCAAISPGIVESELFGHEKGAYTGAAGRAEGKFEYASGGTLFLDEIGDLPLEAQAKLLRALQEKKINRVGGNEEIPVDVRFICATNQDLEKHVEAGRFRRDLFFRINVFPIAAPPLRERKEDITPLAEHFLKRHCAGHSMSLTEGAKNKLMSYHWPGNVRELANAIERAVILTHEAKVIDSEAFSFLRRDMLAGECSNGFQLPDAGISLEEVEKEFVRQALTLSNNNQTAAARLLGISRAKFRVLMKQADRFGDDG